MQRVLKLWCLGLLVIDAALCAAQNQKPVLFTTSQAAWQAAAGKPQLNTIIGYGGSSTALGTGTVSYPAAYPFNVGNQLYSWCCGYSGQALATGTASTTLTFSKLSAFGLQIEPAGLAVVLLAKPHKAKMGLSEDALQGSDSLPTSPVTVTLSDGQTLTSPVIDSTGAQFFGYVGTSITSMTISVPNGSTFAFGNFVSLVNNKTLTLQRIDLLDLKATATPTGGTFAYASAPITGSKDSNADVRMADGITPQTNPNLIKLTSPSNPSELGEPIAGGLLDVTATYALNGKKYHDAFKVPTFGMSCYYTALQSDLGEAPKSCRNTTIRGKTYSGFTKDPSGLIGDYCNSFLAQLRLQGSAVLDSGEVVKYTGGKLEYKTVPGPIKGSDGTPVVEGRTVARDRAIIPSRGVTLDLDAIGQGLLANDVGGGINGYRLDLYQGRGQSVCRNYPNSMAIAECTPSLSTCSDGKVE